MLSYLGIGILLGLSAGFTPGPLLTLVIAESLSHGIWAGIKVALAPVADVPIILVCLFLLSSLSDYSFLLGVISLTGAFLIFFMGYNSMRCKNIQPAIEGTISHSFKKGLLVNMLSPHPYLFWLTVGAPITKKAMITNKSSAIAFIMGFYVLLIGSKIVLAILSGKSRNFLSGRTYLLIMRLLGLLLFIFAGILLRDALILLRS